MYPYHPYFSGEEIEVRKSHVTCPRGKWQSRNLNQLYIILETQPLATIKSFLLRI